MPLRRVEAGIAVASTFNVHQAKTHLSRLLEAASRGEEVVIARNGEPVARLVPYAAARRSPGAARGRGRLTAAFFEDLPDAVLREFEGAP
jgi:prevent-host-death family protein